MKVIIHNITVLTNINSFGEHKRQKQKKKIGLKTLEQSSSGTAVKLSGKYNDIAYTQTYVCVCIIEHFSVIVNKTKFHFFSVY